MAHINNAFHHFVQFFRCVIEAVFVSDLVVKLTCHPSCHTQLGYIAIDIPQCLHRSWELAYYECLDLLRQQDAHAKLML